MSNLNWKEGFTLAGIVIGAMLFIVLAAGIVYVVSTIIGGAVGLMVAWAVVVVLLAFFIGLTDD